MVTRRKGRRMEALVGMGLSWWAHCIEMVGLCDLP